MLQAQKWGLLRDLLIIALLHHGYTDCPPPQAPDGVLLDAKAPYTDGSTVYARCPDNGHIIGPKSMTCIFGMWVPPFVGHCNNDQTNSCPQPLVPDGARLTRQGPFATGDQVGLICDGGGQVIGVPSLSCVFGNWAPPFFGDCSNSERYSCQVPAPQPGMALSTSGVLPSGNSVVATCVEDMKVLIGVDTIRCVLGQWAPNRFGYCVDIGDLGTVVYNSGYGQVIVKFPAEPVIKDLGNDQLLIESFRGGYGIVNVKGYHGIPDSEGYTWSIQNNQIYRNGVLLPDNSGNFAMVLLTGYKRLPPGHGLENIPAMAGVTTRNGILYVNGVPMAERTGSGSTSIEVIYMSGGASSFNVVSNSFVTSI